MHVNPIVNADSIRITFPPQTEENRIINVKKAKATLETAKQRIRDVRKEAQGEYKKLTGISEDLLHHYEEELNNLTKEQNNLLEKIFISKENELMKL
ncbi:hypothetical protein FACS189459_2670 [Bacilli bacterium]|nr:hypothetical protein FACS189459_2670 [Bacilli bacterium]GHU52251.1 hypothetical protein FACS189496_2080 [Bacilli bacterium]